MSATLRHLIEYSSVERFSGSGGALSTNKFTTITFPISTLLGQIKTGQIALPELQRPFVWERSQYDTKETVAYIAERWGVS